MNNDKRDKTLILDIETNAIVNPDKLWCVVTKDIHTGEYHVFKHTDGSLEVDLVRHLNRYGRVIGHNILGYDWRILLSFIRDLPELAITDTLVLSRMLYYSIPNGHSLEAWGLRVGFPKQEFTKFEEFSEEMVEYCKNDVELTHKVYDFLMSKGMGKEEYQGAIQVEHKMVSLCEKMKERGFYFDVEKARKIYEEITGLQKGLEQRLQKVFTPKAKYIREITPKTTKHGTLSKVGLTWWGEDLSGFAPEATFSRISWEPFNPGSIRQVVERLNDAGWKPTEKTEGRVNAERSKDKEKLRQYEAQGTGWKVSEKNLSTLPDDAPKEAHDLVLYLILKTRLSKLEEWFREFNQDTHAIHGTILPIGTWPHRVAHRAPNMGNIPTEKSIKYNEDRHREIALKYGRSMRALWQPRPGNLLVGCDIVGAHLRILAHLCNDPTMIEALLEGDIHQSNSDALGPICRDRNQAKTFIYSFINGAQAPKVGEILNCSSKEAKKALENFDEYYPGFKEFKEKQISKDLDRGYIFGLDARPIIFPKPNAVIAAYLLSGEAAIGKHANVLWHERLTKEGVPFHQLNFIHDEWQTEVEGRDRELAEYVGQVQAESIKLAGEKFNMNIPLAGEYTIGDNWYECH